MQTQKVDADKYLIKIVTSFFHRLSRPKIQIQHDFPSAPGVLLQEWKNI